MRSRPILVLGADRSGTSLVADLIARWGADAGDLSRHEVVDEHNPRGYFEYLPMQEVLHELLAAAHCSVWDPDFPSRIARLAVEPRYRQLALAQVAEMDRSGKPWLWKEPLMSLQMAFWEKIVPSPVCVVTLRNPSDSARSFAKMNYPPELRDELSAEAAFAFRWQFAMLAILDYLERNPDHLFLRYESLLEDPAGQVERLRAFLDRQLEAQEGASERASAMLEAVEPGLWRNRGKVSFFDLPQVTAEQKSLLSHLQDRAADLQAPIDPARYPLPADAFEYLEDFNAWTEHLHQLPRARP